MNKYVSSPNENELLPNLLNLKNREDIEKSEFEGFLLAELSLTEASRTFSLLWILAIRK